MKPEDVLPPALRRSYLLRFVVPLVLLFAVGCQGGDYRPRALGPEGIVYVVIDSTRWDGEIGEAVRETLGQFVTALPAPEPHFRLTPVSLTSQTAFENVRVQKNILIVAPLSDTTNEANFIKSRLGEGVSEQIQSSEGLVIPRDELWRRDQLVVYVTGATPETVVEAIRDNGDDLRYAFNKISRERLTTEMFEKGRQRDLEESLMEAHGFTVNVQHDYQIAIDTTDFVWLRRTLTDTWRSLFIHYVEDANPALLTPSWILATRDSLSRIYLRGNLDGFVEIDTRRELVTENIDFKGRYGFETRGLWQMMGINEEGLPFQFGQGGSFINYSFYDEPTGRIYMIDGMVFAPGFEKREFVRQMEAIAYTFRTAQDLDGPVPIAQN